MSAQNALEKVYVNKISNCQDGKKEIANLPNVESLSKETLSEGLDEAAKANGQQIGREGFSHTIEHIRATGAVSNSSDHLTTILLYRGNDGKAVKAILPLPLIALSGSFKVKKDSAKGLMYMFETVLKKTIYFILFLCPCFSYSSTLFELTSLPEFYNKAPQIERQLDINETGRILIEYVKSFDNGEKLLNELSEKNIGVFPVHRHSRLNPGQIILETKGVNPKNPEEKALVSTVHSINMLTKEMREQIYPSAWAIAPDGKLYGFEYTIDDSAKVVATEEVSSLIQQLSEYIVACGLSCALGILVMDRQDLVRKKNQKYLESNMRDENDDSRMLSVVTIANLDDIELMKNSIPTSLSLGINCIIQRECHRYCAGHNDPWHDPGGFVN